MEVADPQLERRGRYDLDGQCAGPRARVSTGNLGECAQGGVPALWSSG